MAVSSCSKLAAERWLFWVGASHAPASMPWPVDMEEGWDALLMHPPTLPPPLPLPGTGAWPLSSCPEPPARHVMWAIGVYVCVCQNIFCRQGRCSLDCSLVGAMYKLSVNQQVGRACQGTSNAEQKAGQQQGCCTPTSMGVPLLATSAARQLVRGSALVMPCTWPRFSCLRGRVARIARHGALAWEGWLSGSHSVHSRGFLCRCLCWWTGL